MSVETGERLPALPYHLVLTAGRSGWWRFALGLAVLLGGLLIVAPALLLLPFALYYVGTGADLLDSITALADTADPTPASLAYLNLTLAAAIPITWFVVYVIHGLRPGWLASIKPRIRWTYLVACLGVSVVALVATLLVSAVVPSQGDGTELSGQLNDFTSTTRDFLIVLVLLTPLQAAGEEYAFRGYLMQAFGGLFRSRWVAVVASAFLFGLAHGIGQSPPIFFDRFAFGVVAGALVVLTGGLEAGIAMHVLNNWLAFGLALAYGDMASTLNPSGGSWWSIPVTLTQSLVYLGLALLVARRMGLTDRTDPAVLAALPGRR
ncbi:CPBP family intramembrane glutamic endopeptidase [Nocardioides islandensis]|uniref:CPBP family intramembrane glutamic endopeptidase n=1 Tax=Nocardioides islandensis TaxID=433663 RepID=UPI002B26A0E2|nr:type II CAAX endopeptidase family protein [Nocardioides islandensis]